MKTLTAGMMTETYKSMIKELNPDYAPTSKQQVINDLDDGLINYVTVAMIENGCNAIVEGGSGVVTYMAGDLVDDEIDVTEIFCPEKTVDQIMVGFTVIPMPAGTTESKANAIKNMIIDRNLFGYNYEVTSDYTVFVKNEFGGFVCVLQA